MKIIMSMIAAPTTKAAATTTCCRSSWRRCASRILLYAAQTSSLSSSACCFFPRHYSSAAALVRGNLAAATEKTGSCRTVFRGGNKRQERAISSLSATATRSFSAISNASYRHSSSLAAAFISNNNLSSCRGRLRRHDLTTSASSLFLSRFMTSINRHQVDNDGCLLGRQTPEEIKMTRDIRTIIDSAIRAVNPVEAIQNHVRRRVVTPAVGGDDDEGCSLQQWIEIGARYQEPLAPPSSSSSSAPAAAAAAKSSASCQMYNLKDYDKILIVAFGKASSAMATAVVQQLVVPDNNNDNNKNSDSVVAKNKLVGIVICKDGHATPQQVECLSRHNIKVLEASHPIPDQRGVDASRQLLDLVVETTTTKSANGNSTSRTLVIACISGGGSALFCTPHSTLTLDDLQQTNQFLLQSGWSIQEMNIIRKRLEIGKGGGLLQAATAGATIAGSGSGGASSADLVSLVLSDVLGDPLDLIASGPTVPDTSTARDAWNLLQRVANYQEVLPKAVVQLIKDQVKQEQQQQQQQEQQQQENSGCDNSGFDNKKTFTCLVGNNALAVSAAARQAATLGYTPIVLGTQIEGEASTVAQVLMGMAQHVIATTGNTNNDNSKNNDLFAMVSSLPAALIMGGETTVTLPSSNGDKAAGKGGRNQELALAAALALRKYNLRQVVVASVGTDGTDGPTDAAGAIVDGGLIDRLFNSQTTSNMDAKVASSSSHSSSTPQNEAVSALERHDSYHYLARTDREGNSPLVITGPTGTNVADIMVVLMHGDIDHP